MVKKIFGTFGVRGIYGKELFPETANLLGYALGTYLGKGKKVAIGHDTRVSCEDLQNSLVDGLLSSGCEVYKFGCVGTPLTSYFIPRKNMDAGVMITASHNPKEYNGLKFWNSDGSGFRYEQDRAIEKIYYSQKFNSVPIDKNKIYYINNLNEEYIKAVMKRLDVNTIKKANFKVVADCGHGCACYVLPNLLERIGCHVIPLFNEPDGTFPGRSSEPIEANLSEIKKLVKENKADLGVAQDGDADRAVHIDNEGKYQMGDRSFALACYAFLRDREGGTIISTVSTGTVVEDAAKLVNARVLYSIVGEPKIVAMMKKENADIGGEENGGVIYKGWSYARDGIFTTALLLELMAKEDKTFKELNEMLPHYEQIKIKIPCPDEKKQQLLNKIKEKTPKNLKIIDIDGIRINYPDGWLLFRPSGTEPIFRIMAEAKNKKRIKELEYNAKKLVNESLEEI
ncbi:MAG: phosphoglucosamine mutase [Candidatus Helarchaeota archaeon]